MSRRTASTTLCALLGFGLCLGISPAKAGSISLNTMPGMPAPGTPDNGYTAAFFTNSTINALTALPTGLVGGAPTPTSSGLPAGTTGFTPVVVGPNETYPITPSSWMANTTTSSWIGPNAHGASAGTSLPSPINGFGSTDSSPQGYYYYDKSFTLTTTAGASLSGGLWATDNNGISIYLNGHDEGYVSSGGHSFTSFSSFKINPADLVVGTNHIDFVVFNENFAPVHESPTGLRVEGAFSVLPEPSSMVLAALGAIGSIGYVLRRRTAKGG
jgi:hypothetical protein